MLYSHASLSSDAPFSHEYVYTLLYVYSFETCPQILFSHEFQESNCKQALCHMPVISVAQESEAIELQFQRQSEQQWDPTHLNENMSLYKIPNRAGNVVQLSSAPECHPQVQETKRTPLVLWQSLGNISEHCKIWVSLRETLEALTLVHLQKYFALPMMDSVISCTHTFSSTSCLY